MNDIPMTKQEAALYVVAILIAVAVIQTLRWNSGRIKDDYIPPPERLPLTKEEEEAWPQHINRKEGCQCMSCQYRRAVGLDK